METSKPLLKDAEAEDVDVHLYRSMIGSLMYLTASRPDIMFAVCACARFQVTPKVSHLHAVKRIFRYLKGQPKLGLWYPKDSPFDLEAYTDSDYVGASLDRKSTTGGCQFLGSRLISWQCKKQTIVCHSNYRTMFHSKTKHIEIRHHFIRDSNEKKLIQMIKIHTDQNVADLLTKAFDVGRFQYLIATADDAIQVSAVGLTYYCEGFHQIVDFLNTSHIRYALTENPTIYVSLIQQFWQTATASTLDNGEMEITATIDGKVKTVSEASQAASTSVDVRLSGATTTVTCLEAGQGSGNIDKTPTMPHDSPLPRVNTLGSDEGSMQLQELMALCKKLSNKVESLETLKQTKQIYGTAFTKLIKKVKKLEKTVKTKVQERHEHDMESDFEFTAAEEVYTAKKGVSTTELVSTVGASVSTASVSSAKDKGKAIIEEAKTIQTKTKLQQEQERLGYEAALRLQEQLDEEERQRIARVHEAASSFNIEEWEDMQARIEADEELAQRLQAEEREKYSEAEKARLLAELINQRKRHFAQQRAEERRNKPPTQAQQRTYMSNYIKHMESYTLQQLRGYSFDEIKSLFEATMKRVNTFTPMESDVDRTVPKIAAGSSKRDAK
ncbi:hypothetical protein Tco_1447428 [Tanacetum coccineum]